jgi:hypothetical protein
LDEGKKIHPLTAASKSLHDRFRILEETVIFAIEPARSYQTTFDLDVSFAGLYKARHEVLLLSKGPGSVLAPPGAVSQSPYSISAK